MKRFLVRALLLVVVGAGIAAVVAWPRINDVATGKTPEYPDLVPATFSASEARVFEATQSVLGELPRWEIVGVGSGPGGSVIHALHTTPVLRFKDEVTINIRRKAGRTTVEVRSRSRVGKWDFGQNARNIRELLAALQARVS